MYYNILKSKFTQLSTYPQSILVVLFIFTQTSTYEQREKGFWITSIKACFNDLYVERINHIVSPVFIYRLRSWRTSFVF